MITPPAKAAEILLSPADLLVLCDFLYRRTGMAYGESKRYYIERRVADRMEQVGTASFAAYMMLLRSGSPETEQLVNSFTVNETYFYREQHQLECLSRSILPEIVARRQPGDLVRIWCAPCSTGEEPYSVAMWLLENWALVDAYNIEIIGSDIDTRALADAARGVYGARAVSRLQPDVIARYFDVARAGEAMAAYAIIQDLRESVRFTPVNLMDAASVAAQGRFDVILCRNVMIYFDDTARAQAAAHLYGALNPGGFICLGHTESMTRISERFLMRRLPDAIVYQRPGDSP